MSVLSLQRPRRRRLPEFRVRRGKGALIPWEEDIPPGN